MLFLASLTADYLKNFFYLVNTLLEMVSGNTGEMWKQNLLEKAKKSQSGKWRLCETSLSICIFLRVLVPMLTGVNPDLLEHSLVSLHNLGVVFIYESEDGGGTVVSVREEWRQEGRMADLHRMVHMFI